MLLRKVLYISCLNMKGRQFALVLGCLGISLLASAGEYHTGASLVCSQCHSMHYSQSHTYAGADDDNGNLQGTPPDQADMSAGGPYEKLLRDADSALCLSCHKSHGNKNSFGLIYMKGVGDVTEEGAGTGSGAGAYIDLCQQCHVQGAL